MPPTAKGVPKHAFCSLLCHNVQVFKGEHIHTQFSSNFEITKCCGYREYKVKVIEI